MSRKVLLPALAAAAIAIGVFAFTAYKTFTAGNPADAQLRATAALLLPHLVRTGVWAGPRAESSPQKVLDSYADVFFTRRQFAVVCWGFPGWHSLVPRCAHETGVTGERLVMDAGQMYPNEVGGSSYTSVAVWGYATPLVLPKSMQKQGYYGVLDVFQVSG